MFNIKVNIFACRPYLSEYRCEDIIINSDYDEFINEKNKINFIVLDTHSKLHLSRYSICSELYINTQYKNISVFKDGILLLFTDRNFNQKLMNVLENVDLSDVNVYVRQHPFESITNEIHNRLNKVSNKIMFIDQLDWKEITFQNVYTIVSNSTSAVDANISGCNIIWAPFLSHNFLQFIPHSQMFGTLISSHDELAIFLKNISFK